VSQLSSKNEVIVPYVSVIVPCRNEEQYISGCIDSILDTDYPREKVEILIVDGRSTDATREQVIAATRIHPGVRLLDNPKGHTPVAFNIGIRAARGEILMLLGAHSKVAPNYIRLCVDALHKYGADNVGGVMRTLPRSEGLIAHSIVAVLTHRFGVGGSQFRLSGSKAMEVDTVFGGCYRREVFDRIGLFNEDLPASQDFELNYRLRSAGGRIMLVPEIETYYYARSDLRSFIRHNWRNGLWVVLPLRYSRNFPVSVRHLVPLGFILSLGTSAAAIPVSVSPILTIVGSYSACSIAAAVQVAIRERNVRFLLSLPPMFAALHLTYGLGSLFGALLLFPSAFSVVLKRCFDIAGAIVGLTALAPVFTVVAVLILLEDGGTPLYRGPRVGKDGQLFQMLKFRTMVVDADKIGGSSTANDDQRITKIGKFLRRTKLDELPQLFNVLIGDMSLVGPRPEVEEYTRLYRGEELSLLDVKPGITDFATIWNPDEGTLLAGEADPDKAYLEKVRPQKLRLQLKYVRERGFWTDLRILGNTAWIVARKFLPF